MMNEQYFTHKPQSHHQEKQIQAQMSPTIQLNLTTDSGVFSKDRVDFGSTLLVQTFIQNLDLEEGHILELGSGYGPIAISLAKAYPQAQISGVEINERAYQLAIQNGQANQTPNIDWFLDDATTVTFDKTFDYVLTNPPIRAGKPTIQAFVRNAHQQLREGGSLWLVIQKKQGAPSMVKFMEELFGNVSKEKQDKGYWILQSTK